jgi:ubiquinone/menaquinone biosynthesis C-methylase UbiE
MMTTPSQSARHAASAILNAGRFARGIAGKVKRKLMPPRDYVVHRGSVLPAPDLRFNGPDQQDNNFYLNSSISETNRVVTRLGYQPGELLVEIGSGQGRLAIGMVRRFPSARYLGLDVSKRSVDWCQRHIERRHPSYRFQYLHVLNALYNPSGEPLTSAFRLPVEDASADAVYLWGVVTNMEPEHFPLYAREIARMLRKGRRMFLTANVEDNVPTVTINPENYTSFKCSGPLHIVRYEKNYFIDVFRQVGLSLTDLDHHAAGNCQSELYFRRD